jgi:hypothetical protein
MSEPFFVFSDFKFSSCSPGRGISTIHQYKPMAGGNILYKYTIINKIIIKINYYYNNNNNNIIINLGKIALGLFPILNIIRYKEVR